jgi:glycosyltransferase involved in cell wall biosynthesis
MTPGPVSVVIAAYNRGPRIAPTLDSVLAQTERPAEVIVVDDCSPDRTGDWVEAHYPGVRVVRPERNGGTSAARNLGARAATGTVLVFLDHDDVLHPHAVATLRGLLGSFPEARAAFADHTYVNTVTGVKHPDHHTAQPAFARLGRVPVDRSGPPGRVYHRPLFYALVRGNLLQQPWAVYRDTFLKLGGFAEDVRYCEDWDLYLRVTRSVPIALTDTVISDHIIEGENLHLSPNQVGMYRRVLRRLVRAEPLNPRVFGPAARKLAMYAKAEGDNEPDPGRAWRAYFRSFLLWPFDHVVAARALVLWPLKRLLGRPLRAEARS